MKRLLALIPVLLYSQTIRAIPLDPAKPGKTNYLIFEPKNKINSYLVHLSYADDEDKAFYKKCNEKGILVITVRDLPTFLFFENDYVKDINLVLKQLDKKYNLKNKKFIIGGMSRFGNGAIYFAEYANKNKTKYIPDGIFAVDPPVDLEEMWNWSKFRKITDKKRKKNEPLIVKKELIKVFGGSPGEFPGKYMAQSPYYRSDDYGGNIKYIKDTPLIIFVESDINWWIENRASDLYTSNILPISSMINDLRALGNADAKLIVTRDKGYRSNGTRHPHSWSIVDESYLIDWMISLKQ